MAKIRGIKTKVGDTSSAVAKVTADASGGTPVSSGIVTMLAQGTVPSGWLLCDGAEYDQSAYSGLYSVIGGAYNTHPTLGSATAGKFRVPDFRDMFPMAIGQTMPSRYNLLTYSEQFNNADWGKLGCNAVADQTTAPDGTLTADLLQENSLSSLHGFYRASGTSISNGVDYIFSVYLKSSGRDVIHLYPDAVASGFSGAVIKVNATTGAIVSYGTAKSVLVTNAGNGWFRFECVCTATATSASPGFYLSNGGAESYTGNGTSGVYVWGAQLVLASSFPANTYQRITTAASYNTGDLALGTYSTTGWNHTHEVPAHAHTLGNHTHTLGSHTHSVAAHSHTTTHTHTIPSHTHGVAQHIHYFAAHQHSHAIGVTASHYHQESLTSTTTTGTALTRCGQSTSTFNLGTGSAGSSYSINIGGTVGSTYLADSGFNTDWYSLSDATATGAQTGSTGNPSANSGNSTIFNSGTPSAASGAPSSNTTSTDSATATGSENPPYFGVHFIIKT